MDALHEFVVCSTSMAHRARPLRIALHRTTLRRNVRAALVSTMDAAGDVVYRVVTHHRCAPEDAILVMARQIDSPAFLYLLLQQFLLSGGWTRIGPDRQRV